MDLNLQDKASLLLTPLIGCYKSLKLITQLTESDFIGLRFFDAIRHTVRVGTPSPLCVRVSSLQDSVLYMQMQPDVVRLKHHLN